MSIPAAILIAGVVIAGAVYFSRTGPSSQVIQQQQATPAPRPASLDIRPITSDDHIRGPENAKVTVVEYSDLECPYCKVFHQSMVQLLNDYPNDIRWVYRHAPIEQLHPNAPAFANASECAAVQGKFWEFTDVAFATASTNKLDLVKLPDYAREAGVTDISAFQACVEANTFAEKVQADLEDGLKAGPELFGTPFNMVITADGTKAQLGGGVPYDQLKATIESIL